MIKKKRTTINLGRYYVDDELSVRFTPSVIDRILEVAAIVISVVAFGLACYGIYSLPIKPPMEDISSKTGRIGRRTFRNSTGPVCLRIIM